MLLFTRTFSILALLLAGISTPLTGPVPLTGIRAELGQSPEDLVINQFIKGGCRTVSTIQSFGDSTGIGFFTNAQNILGFSNGIVLSTGDVRDIAGPNESIETTTSFNNAGGDADLDLFATDVVLDATGIEFDFVPLSDQVSFRYVFASEEYCEFVGSIFNDNFGFFVSGPGINGEFFNESINVATLPGTNEYVTINNVNHQTNSDAYIGNELREDARKCEITHNASYEQLFEFDGFTIPLIATFNVIPCETYHIRLVVGDVGDDKLDSAVFLESKSFDIGTPVLVEAVVEGSLSPIAYENCKDGAFVFSRGDRSDRAQDLEVNFTISPLSDASPGSDFAPLPQSITIPAGAADFTLPVTVIADLLPEPPERLRLEIEYDCECLDPDQSDLIIADLDTLQSTFEEVFVCPDQEFTTGPSVVGGAAPYTYLWNTNATTPLLTASVSEPTHFTVTITDACGQTGLSIVGASIQEVPVAEIRDTIRYCEGSTDFLTVDLEGHSPWSITYEIDGETQAPITGIEQNPFPLPVTQSGIYTLSRFEDAFCLGQPSGTALVLPDGVQVDIKTSAPSCPTIADGQIQVNIVEGVAPYQIEWSQTVDDSLNLSNLSVGQYTLSITDAKDCLSTFEIELSARAGNKRNCLDFLLYVPNAFSPNADNVNDWFSLYPAEQSFIQRIVRVQLFNRWGDLMLENTTLEMSPEIQVWDGSFRGKRVDAGVYVWMIEVELEDGSRQTVSGDLTLIR